MRSVLNKIFQNHKNHHALHHNFHISYYFFLYYSVVFGNTIIIYSLNNIVLKSVGRKP